MTFLPAGDLLSFDEIDAGGPRRPLAGGHRGAAHRRRAAGAPGLAELVGRLAALGFDDLALTTNGMLLARRAGSSPPPASTG